MTSPRTFALLTSLVLSSLAGSARAQFAPGSGAPPPASPTAAPPTPVATYPAPVVPVAPASEAPPQAAGPPPGYGPPPATPPAYGPAPVYPAPAFGAPGPMPAPAPYPPPPAPTPALQQPERGLYVSTAFGVGGPFGGTTTGGYNEGFGFLGTAGYAIIPNFGLDLFVHWNHTSLSESSGDLQLKSNSGHVLLYGAEARGIAGAGPVVAWVTLGVSLGSGSLGLELPPETFSAGTEATVHFSVMPVLALGAEYRIIGGLAIGPQIRWYITNVTEACTASTATSPGFDTSASASECAKSFDRAIVPDIVFLGVGATYRIDLLN